MNQLKFITLTGADDSVDPVDLFTMAGQFPFVEWGILVSMKRFGTERFPSLEWLDDLTFFAGKTEQKLNLSLHLCGSAVRKLLMEGNVDFLTQIGNAWILFDRIQINTHGEDHEWDFEQVANFINRLAEQNKQIIFQWDGSKHNQNVIRDLADQFANVHLLFDCSHGAGKSPDHWPSASGFNTGHGPIFLGYAGGLGPDNINEEIKKIRQAVTSVHWNGQYWIDMETKLRSENDQFFLLKKCEQVLEAAKVWFETPKPFPESRMTKEAPDHIQKDNGATNHPEDSGI